MYNGFTSLTSRRQSYRIAYENEYSNFYDYMLYGSASAMEHALKKVKDWRGFLAVAMAYDLGLTGLTYDPDKAKYYYTQAKNIVSASDDRTERLTGNEFFYAYNLDSGILLHPVSSKERRVRKVITAFIATSRGADCGLLDVEYILGVAYSYRLANLVKAIPVDVEEQNIRALIDDSLELMDIYSRQNMDSMKAVLKKAEENNYSFLLFLLGMIFWDAYRNPLSITDIRMNLTPNFKEMGVELLKKSAEKGSIAAFLYLNDIACGSSIGRAAVTKGCGLEGADPTEAILGWSRQLTGSNVLEDVLRKHTGTSDEMLKYHVIL